MKKLWIVAVLIASSLGLFFLFRGHPQQRVEAADCLPADVLFYGEQLEFTKMYQTFLGSRMGRTLTRLDYAGIAADLGWSKSEISEVEGLWAKVSGIVNAPGFDELLGREFAVAVFPAKSFSAANPAQDLAERLLLVVRPRHNLQVIQFLAPLLSRKIPQSTVQYGSHTITRYQIDEDNTLATATVQGLILAGFEERLVRKSLDYYDDKRDTLSGNPAFQRLREGLRGASLFTYLSLPALSAQGRMIGEEMSVQERGEFFALLDQWDGWGAAAYGAWHEKGVVKDRAEILFDEKILDSRVARLCKVSPAVNTSLPLVPADTLLYYWTNTLNIPLLWELYRGRASEEQEDEGVAILRRELRGSAGVELEEVLAMIGDEFAIIVEDVDRDGVPLPKAALLIKLKEPQKFQRVFDLLIQNAEIPVNHQRYQDQDITYWGMALQGGLQPAFTRIGEYLLVSNSIDLVKKVVELQEDPAQGLLQSIAMKEVGMGFLEKNNSATYVYIAKLADSLKDLAIWAGGMAVLQGPQRGHQANIVVNQLFLPLLDGVAMYTQLGSRSIIGDDSIILESTMTIVQ